MKRSLKNLPAGARIVVGVAPDGSVNSRVHGIDGPACEGFLDNLTDLFETVEHGHTNEYDVTAEVAASVGACA